MGLGVSEKVLVGVPPESNVADVLREVASLPRRRRRGARHVLVGEKGCQSGDASDLLGGQHVGSVVQRRAKIIPGDAVFVGNRLHRRAARQLPDHHLYNQPCARTVEKRGQTFPVFNQRPCLDRP